jgi:hypothetical protein
VSTSASLLEQASSVLEGAGGHSNRAACWIARAALESAVDDLLDTTNTPAPDATMRSKLTVLQVASGVDSTIPGQADYAWNGLSRACHHHAFELSPTATEVRHLIAVVAGLIDQASQDDSGAAQ